MSGNMQNQDHQDHIEISESGIETMNKSDAISEKTKLFGLMAEYASQDRLFVLLNRVIKESSANAMMIPMNIREDDFYFTLSNMKKSHVNGTYIANEYQKDAVVILDSQEELVEIAGRCDFALRQGETLHGDFITPLALQEYINKLGAKKIAIIGSGSLARALAVILKEYELSFYAKYIETLLSLSEAVEMEIDINRIDSDMPVNLGMYDVVIDVSKEDVFESVTALAKVCIDLNSEKNFSALQLATTRFKDSNYFGYEALIDEISKIIYKKYLQ